MGDGLKARFERFVRTLNGFESIDELLRDNDPDGMKRADYLLIGRSIIIEQKSLESDPSDKPQKYVDSLMQKGRFIFYGRQSSDSLFRQLPDGDKLKAGMFDYLTNQINRNISDADKQTRDTREIFGIPDATGILVLLNEHAKTLAPDIIRYGVERAYQKKLPDGSRRYGNNVGVIVISEAHPLPNDANLTMFPILQMSRPGLQSENIFEPFFRWLTERWAKFNGVPLLQQHEVK